MTDGCAIDVIDYAWYGLGNDQRPYHRHTWPHMVQSEQGQNPILIGFVDFGGHTTPSSW